MHMHLVKDHINFDTPNMMWLLFLHCPLDVECQVCLTNKNLHENPIPKMHMEFESL
jgi:hypothetical protein